MNHAETDHGPIASTVVTASRILEEIAERGRVVPQDLARALDLNRSTVHRMLHTLQILNYVGKQPDGSYRLTFHLFEIGNTVPESRNLIDTARSELLALSHETGYTANHGVLFDDRVLYVDKVTPASYLQLELEVGESEPLHCTSLGKVLLAFTEEEERRTIIDRIAFDRYTDHTITDRPMFAREIERVYAEGWAIDDQELALELRCVAVPVLRTDGGIVSAVSLSGPSDRLLPNIVQKLLPYLQQTATRIAANIHAL